MTYSLDFRKKVLSIRSKEKLSFAQVARRFGVSVNSVFLWSKRLKPRRTKIRPAIKIDREWSSPNFVNTSNIDYFHVFSQIHLGSNTPMLNVCVCCCNSILYS
ncbi:hypothetical protein [Candidatus Neptunichlamydia sp. REUL1]|uniref:hypothetical protein n=1 Tax=Candidatus Neptunichlamydia sp. REUL1 TaxID=3064277 RepID=UPI00292E053B|nr:hypothetical protein [Candidatus Neptunochlamydia sp. REUL1]